MKNKLLKPGLALAFLAFFASSTSGCHTVRRGEPLTGLTPIPNEKMDRGKVVFFSHCNYCHPGGEAGLGPALNNKPAPAFLLKTQVRLGLGAMPAFKKEQISPEDLDDLVAYVIALRKADRPVSTTNPASVGLRTESGPQTFSSPAI